MSRTTITLTGLAVSALAFPALAGGWVNFTNETSVRLPTSGGLNTPGLSTNDPEEKDYAWGDVDNDGDVDLVCVRKQPFTSTGKEVNVLFMNEGIAEGHAIDGILVDRTSEYASDSDIGGDNGFLTPTNDRDVILHDLNNDGWLDIITATTLTDNQAKHLSHPRIYINLGESAGVWLGFRHEDARIPLMHATAGPRFCSVSAGDVTGDGFADLYFGDYDSGGSQIMDYNNRLLINDGNGFFTDQTTSRLTSQMSEAAFGAASVMADMNNDGVMDIVKQTSLNSPTHIAVTYNNPANEGFFNLYDTVYANAPYFVSVGDLNQDGRLDLVVTDDGTDAYMLNQGNDGSNQVDFLTLTLPSDASSGFGSNSIITDLNNDGHQDILIADVDVDIGGCSRRTHIYRNLGNLPNVSFQEQGQVIPNGMLGGTHDIAVIDLNNDGWDDLVIGRCNTTEIWMNVPPTGLVFSYPDGLPAFLTPGDPTLFRVSVAAIGGGTHNEKSGLLFHSIEGGPFVETTMTPLGGNEYQASLPGVDCTQRVRFYVSAETDAGGSFRDPASAPVSTYNSVAADGLEITLRDDMEGDLSGWTTSATGGTTSGFWEAVDPHFTIGGSGELAAPGDDATQGAENVICFVTDDTGVDNSGAGDADIDGGTVYLMSPLFDLDGTDATISYARWFFCNDEGLAGADTLETQISNNGGANWTTVTSVSTPGTDSAWDVATFVVGDWILPSATMQVRFVASDDPNDSVTEAGIDNFQIEEIICGTACIGDIDESGDVGFGDLVALLASWGACPGCAADIDGSGDVGFSDLVALLAAWGPCP